MGHDAARLAQARKQLAQLLLQLVAHHRIERAERLIEEQHVRIEHERPHQAHALALSAGEIVRLAAQRLERQLHEIGELGDALLDPSRVAGQSPRDQRDVRGRGQMRKQAARLNDVANALTHLDRIVQRQELARDADCAAPRPQQPTASFSSVDLPQPLGPMSATVSPAATLSETSSSAATWSYVWLTLS